MLPRVIVITPPASVVSLDEAKEHLRVRHDTEDDLIEDKVALATGYLDGPDGILNRAIGIQTLEAELPSFDCRLPCPEIITIESVKYLDSDRAEQTIAAENYTFHGRYLVPATSYSWPSIYSGTYAHRLPRVRVRYVAGYAVDPTADTLVQDLPERLKAAILLITGDLYKNREATVTGTIAASIPLTTTIDNLKQRFQVYE